MQNKRDKIIFQGVAYYRYEGRRYYDCYPDKKGLRKSDSLHRAIWKFYRGDIPPGHQIHHKDGDWDNNSIENLECVTPAEHNRIHGVFKRWNKTEKAKIIRDRNRRLAHLNAPFRSYVCKKCGKKFRSKSRNGLLKFCSKICSLRYRLGYNEKQCKICDKLFWGRPGAATCSEKCSIKYWSATCPVCKKVFEKGQSTQTYCCKSCRATGEWAKRRARV